jgi:hypothetical protein
MTPDRVAGWAVGAGIGSTVFIVTWIIANRLTGLWLPVPAAPIVALVGALVAGGGVALERGRVLSRAQAAERTLTEVPRSRDGLSGA